MYKIKSLYDNKMNYETYLEMNKAGIVCFLMTTNHNMKYDVGYKRIESFQDFKQRFL